MSQNYDYLDTSLNIASPDDFYQALLDTHMGLTDQESQKLNAKLIMILANHIGDQRVLNEALTCAKNT